MQEKVLQSIASKVLIVHVVWIDICTETRVDISSGGDALQLGASAGGNVIISNPGSVPVTTVLQPGSYYLPVRL